MASIDRRTAIAGMLAGTAGLAPVRTIAAQEATPGATPEMDARSQERLRRATRWETAVYGRSDVGALRELASPDFRSPYPGREPGLEALAIRLENRAAYIAETYDSYGVVVDEAVASGDVVVTRTIVLTAKGDQSATVIGLSWYVFDADDLVTTTWSLIDQETIDDLLGLEG